MIAHDRSYPHPVLAPFRDDVLPNVFSLSLSVAYDAAYYFLNVAIEHQNPTLSSLVIEGRASYAAHVECRRNFYRHLHSSSSPNWRITIPSSDIAGRVEVTPLLLAMEPIEAYQIAGAHTDYGDTRFRLGKGDILAVGQTSTFEAYTDYDPLKRVSSILTIRRSETDPDGPMIVDTIGDKITATLSQIDYDQYTHLRGDPALVSLLSNQVVVPALLQALFEMAMDGDESVEEGMSRRWYRSVDAKLTQIGINLRQRTHTPLDAVQALLRGPLRRSLADLMRATTEDDAEP